MVAGIDEPAFTRADVVELVGALLPVDAPGDPRALIEQVVDAVGLRVSASREAQTQIRFRGTGPKFIKRGSRVLYRWSDVSEWLDRNTFQRIDDPRHQR
jgi:hypothetical protein